MREELLAFAVASLDEHKAENLICLDVTGKTSVADAFLLASGGSATQVRALSDYLEEALAKKGIAPRGSEGYQKGDWIVLDYGELLVHIFRREIRDFYGLEHLWSDAVTVDIAPFMKQE